MTLDQFYAKTNSFEFGNPPPQLVPNQGTFQGECVSIIRQLLESVYAIPTGTWGNAVDYWTKTNPAILAKFDKLPGNTSFKDGDILVWGDDPGTWTNQFGHIAYWYKGQIQSQNFSGRKTAGGNAFFSPGYLGTLRPKSQGGNKMNQENAIKVVNNTYKYIAGHPPTADNIAYWTKQLVADPNIMDEFEDRVAEDGAEFQRRANQYEQDIAAAKLSVTTDPNAAALKTALKNFLA